MTKAEKEKLFRELKAFMKNNFYLQNNLELQKKS